MIKVWWDDLGDVGCFVCSPCINVCISPLDSFFLRSRPSVGHSCNALPPLSKLKRRCAHVLPCVFLVVYRQAAQGLNHPVRIDRRRPCTMERPRFGSEKRVTVWIRLEGGVACSSRAYHAHWSDLSLLATSSGTSDSAIAGTLPTPPFRVMPAVQIRGGQHVPRRR